MSTWTSRIAVVAGTLALTACDTGANVTRKAPMQVKLPDGLVVAGARGWCVDAATSRVRSGPTVIVLGSCAALAGNALLPKPPVEGVVTISIEAESVDVPSLESLAAYLSSEDGRAVLARDGRADSLDLIEIGTTDRALFLHALDKSGGQRSTGEDYWRALFDIEGRFVTVSLVTAPELTVSREESLATLNAQVDRLKAANAP